MRSRRRVTRRAVGADAGADAGADVGADASAASSSTGFSNRRDGLFCEVHHLGEIVGVDNLEVNRRHLGHLPRGDRGVVRGGDGFDARGAVEEELAVFRGCVVGEEHLAERAGCGGGFGRGGV